MGNHFGKGLLAGLKAQNLKPAAELSKFCSDYKRGFVLGYAHRLAESTGDENQAAFEAGSCAGIMASAVSQWASFSPAAPAAWRKSSFVPAITGRVKINGSPHFPAGKPYWIAGFG